VSDTSSITGKIAAVVDATTLVLNVGQDQGVREGMIFAVVAAHQQITDPDSGESLGHWEDVKARVVVTHVQERMCTARPPLAEGTASGTLSEMMVRHSFGEYGDRSAASARIALEVVQGTVSGKPRMEPIALGDAVRFVAPQPVAPAHTMEQQAGDLPSQAYGGLRDSQGSEAEQGPSHEDESEDACEPEDA